VDLRGIALSNTELLFVGDNYEFVILDASDLPSEEENQS
jgi:hypothetical protein